MSTLEPASRGYGGFASLQKCNLLAMAASALHEGELVVIRHVFSWRVAPGYDANEVVAILNTLPEKLPEIIKGWDIGQHKGDPGDNGSPWDGALITDFDSWEGLEAYSHDPYHLSVVATLTPRFADRAVVDYERSDS